MAQYYSYLSAATTSLYHSTILDSGQCSPWYRHKVISRHPGPLYPCQRCCLSAAIFSSWSSIFHQVSGLSLRYHRHQRRLCQVLDRKSQRWSSCGSFAFYHVGCLLCFLMWIWWDLHRSLSNFFYAARFYPCRAVLGLSLRRLGWLAAVWWRARDASVSHASFYFSTFACWCRTSRHYISPIRHPNRPQ